MSKLILIISLFLLSGCDGAHDLAKEEFQKAEQGDVEKFLINKTPLNENLSIAKSISDAINSIHSLEVELENLDKEINNIDTHIESVKENQTEKEIVEYMNYLDSLIDSSKGFTAALKESVYSWDAYLKGQDPNELNFSKLNKTIVYDSIVNPATSFETVD